MSINEVHVKWLQSSTSLNYGMPINTLSQTQIVEQIIWLQCLPNSMYNIICCVKCSLISISGLICVALISLFGILSNRFSCKINICCCNIFTVES